MKINARKHGKKSRNKKGSRAKSKQRGPRYWVAMGTMSALLACAPVSSKAAAAPGSGLSTYSAWEVIYRQDPDKARQVSRFDIPPGPLESVLATFQNLTGLQVVIPSGDIKSISSPGVSGALTTEKALQQLLAGTGITYRFTGPAIVTLELKSVEGSVEILGRISPSSPKYTEPIRDTPQTINIIPKAVIEEQGATTLRDVLRNVPGLTVAAGEGGAPAGDNLTLRGFSARNDIFVDGVRDLSPQSRDPFNLEQVEVIKGPNSSFNGRGSTGGTINLVTKTPNIRPLYSGTLSFGTDETKRITTDVNIPFKDRYAFRLNLMGHDSAVAGRDVVKNQRWGVAPSLATGLGTRSRFIFSYLHLKQDNIPDYGIPWVTNTHNILTRDTPAPVDRENFYGLRSRDFEEINADIGTISLERDFNDNLTMRNQLRYSRATRDSITTAPRFFSNDSLEINRNGPSWITEDNIWDNQTDLRSRFSTGEGIEHRLVAGLALTHENNQRITRTIALAPRTDLNNPDPDQAFNGTTTLSPFVGDITGKSMAVYAFDTARLGKRWELTGGLRWDYFDVEGVPTAGLNAAPPPRTARIDRMFSGRGAIVFKPRAEGSIYASYGTSVNPSLEGLSYQTVSPALEPEKTYTVEVGSKWDLLGERLTLTGAIFNVDKTNARTPDLTTPGLMVLDGKLRVQGIELGASGSITRTWRVLAGYALLDSRVVRSNTPAEVNRRFQNAPRNSFNLWTTYLVRSKLNLGGGVRFIGRRFGNAQNTRWVDNYYTIDGLVSYPITSKIDLRLNLYNLNDAYYFDRLGGGHLLPGPGRSVMVSTGFRL